MLLDNGGGLLQSGRMGGRGVGIANIFTNIYKYFYKYLQIFANIFTIGEDRRRVGIANMDKAFTTGSQYRGKYLSRRFTKNLTLCRIKKASISRRPIL